MKIKKYVFLVVITIIFTLFSACGSKKGTSILYQGHASLRITSIDGIVIYVDPNAGEGYDVPADIILVTHGHGDHSMKELPEKKDDCVIITQNEALIIPGEHQSFSVKGVEIQAVKAKSAQHSEKACVGYIITVDGFKIYVAGDTAKTDQMETFAALEIDYAFLPCDGGFTMDAKTAAECAEIIGAKHNIPYHTDGDIFNREVAESFDAPNRLILEPGETIYLKH